MEMREMILISCLEQLSILIQQVYNIWKTKAGTYVLMRIIVAVFCFIWKNT